MSRLVIAAFGIMFWSLTMNESQAEILFVQPSWWAFQFNETFTFQLLRESP